MAFNDPARRTFLLLTLVQGSVTHRYTDWSAAVTTADGTFTSWPALKIELAPNTMSIGEKPLVVKFPTGRNTFFDKLVNGAKTGEVLLSVKEVHRSVGPINTLGYTQGQAKNFGTYRLTRGQRSLDGMAGEAQLEFLGIKGRLNVPLGIVCRPACAWAFGDKTCGIDVDALEETGTIATISRKVVTLTNPTDAAVVTAKPYVRYWHRGYMRIDNHWIPIRDWSAGYSFQLAYEPPTSWLGQVVTLRPGCGKSLADCELRNNTEQFGGFGLGVPAYLPIVGVP
jgi:hypothetical protein